MPEPQLDPNFLPCIQCLEERRARKQALEPIDLDDDAVAALIEIGELLREMRTASIAEGYVFKDGKIIPPHKKASGMGVDS